MASLTAYLAVTRAELKTAIHFRANLIAWCLFTPLKLAVLYLVWRIIYQHTDRVGGLDFPHMMLYYTLITYLTRVLDPVQQVNYQVWEEINQGKLDIYLARPIHYGGFAFARCLATPLIEAVLGLPFVLGFALLLGLPLPTRPWVWVLFAVAAAQACLLMFLIQFIIGSLTFWMERIFGIRDMIFSVFMLLSGQLIPLTALPAWVQTLSRFLPFEGILFMPASIALSDDPGNALFYLVRQSFWCLILLLAAAVVWTRGVPRYASQGG